eukprot:1538079-Ditylum_brightwellii.AAC.1
MLNLVNAIKKKYSLLCKEQVFSAMDRLKLYLQQSSMICVMVTNVPGGMHESTAAEYGFIYEKLDCLLIRCGAKTVVDTTFLLKRNEFLIKSSQKDVRLKTPQELVLNKQTTSVCQMYEWGMQ